MGLLDYAIANEAVRTVACTLTSGSNVVTSAGLFVPEDVDREFSSTGSGVPGSTLVTGYTDASHITISNNATASGARTGVMGARTWRFPNQATITPVHSKISAARLGVSIVAPPSGIVNVVMSAAVVAWPSGGTDSYLEWCVLLSDDTVFWPNSAGGVGRRVQLSQSSQRRMKMEFEMTLTPNTPYDLWWGAGTGNQVEGSGTNEYRIRGGGTRGPALFEVWS